MQQLEWLKYVTALDLNMGYYNIRILPDYSVHDDDSYQIW